MVNQEGGTALEEDRGKQNEWICWKFTPEEEKRRKGYLPLP